MSLSAGAVLAKAQNDMRPGGIALPGIEPEAAPAQSDVTNERRFVAAVEAIYDAAPDPSRWPQALQAIADVFGDVGTVLLFRRDDGSFGTIVSPELVAAQDAYGARWWREDIRSFRGVERGYTVGQDAITDKHVVTLDEIKNHSIYTQFLIPHGLGWFAGVAVSPDPRVQVWISVQRAISRPPYSDAELEIVTKIGRQVEKALRLSIRLLDSELASLGLREALSRLGIGVFALDSLERVIFANPAGERLLGDALHLAGDRLRVASIASRQAVEEAIGRALRAAPSDLVAEPKPILVERKNSPRPLTIYVLPVRSSGSPSQEFLTYVRAIVLAIDPIADDPPDPAVVRDLLGLTLGEARVASLVGSGLPPREAAEKLGISEETARTTLKRVFSKVGVSRQSELTALLSRIVLR